MRFDELKPGDLLVSNDEYLESVLCLKFVMEDFRRKIQILRSDQLILWTLDGTSVESCGWYLAGRRELDAEKP